jgi:hypothetical protein
MMSSRKFAEALIVITGLIAGGVGAVRGAAATEPSGSTADFYRSINQMLTVDCPASSDLTYPSYPPFGVEWDQMEASAWKADQPALQRLHEGRSIQRASWPDLRMDLTRHGGDNYLNPLRAIANHIGDAALYQHLQGDDAGAIDTAKDLFVMSDLLEQKPWDSQARVLVAAGIRALGDYRLMIIASDVHLTDEPADRRSLQAKAARAFIDGLLTQNDPAVVWDATTRSGHWDILRTRAGDRQGAIETFNRVNTEQTFAAMSLASHLFFMDHGRWPNSIDELVPAYLPHQSIDPWGDGHQMLGYVLVKGGLPDGSDRPMVYSRCGSQDGLFYRVDRPEYGFYSVHPSDPSPALRLHGGQFRDVTAWLPAAGLVAQPTTRSFE